MTAHFDYPFELRPLDKEEGGGGWLIIFPDVPGCMSDGETPEEAMANGRDALAAWIKAAEDVGREIPRPDARPSGKFVARIPRSLHAHDQSKTGKRGQYSLRERANDGRQTGGKSPHQCRK